jgi:uncharacterized small protein (DUF1192 family)
MASVTTINSNAQEATTYKNQRTVSHRKSGKQSLGGLARFGAMLSRFVRGARSGLRAVAIQSRALRSANELQDLRIKLLRQEVERVRAQCRELRMENFRLSAQNDHWLTLVQADDESPRPE